MWPRPKRACWRGVPTQGRGLVEAQLPLLLGRCKTFSENWTNTRVLEICIAMHHLDATKPAYILFKRHGIVKTLAFLVGALETQNLFFSKPWFYVAYSFLKLQHICTWLTDDFNLCHHPFCTSFSCPLLCEPSPFSILANKKVSLKNICKGSCMNHCN